MAAQTADRRPVGALGRMSVVAGIHVAVFYLIARGLDIIPSVPEMITKGVLIEDPVHETVDVPPIKDPVMDPFKTIDLVPPVEPLIPQDPTEKTVAAEPIPLDSHPPTSGSAVVVPELLPPRLDDRRPLSQPPYPAEMIRANAQGSVDVEVFVEANGRVTDARIAKTSGYDAFDKSTLDEAKRRWRLMPATRDGAPIAQWYRLRVVFKLKDG